MQRGFTDTKRSNVWGLVSLAASVRRDENQQISEWGSSFQAEAMYGSFNVTVRDKILEIFASQS